MKQKLRIISILLVCLLTISSLQDNVYAYEWDDDNYEMADPYLDFAEIYDKDMTLYMGDKYKLDYEYDCYYDPVWETSDPHVVNVNSNGKITAIGPGEAEIKILCGACEDSIKITVKRAPSYKSLAKKMKKFAKKNKGFEYDNIDVGNKCRLYAYSFSSSDSSKIESEGYAYVTAYKSYIELTKKKGKAHIKLVIWGEVIELSIYDVSLYPDILKLSTSNRILKYDLKSISAKDRYEDGVYISDTKSYAVIDSDTKKNKKKVTKYKKMLSQKSFKMKFSFWDDAYYQVGTNKKIRKNWKKLATLYQKLLKEF